MASSRPSSRELCMCSVSYREFIHLTERREAVRRRVDHLHDPIIRHEHERYQHDARNHQNHDGVLFVLFHYKVNNRLAEERREEPAGREGEGVVLGDLCAKRSVSPSRRQRAVRAAPRPRDLCTDDHEAHDPDLRQPRRRRDEHYVRRRRRDRLGQTTKLDQQRPEDHAAANTQESRSYPSKDT